MKKTILILFAICLLLGITKDAKAASLVTGEPADYVIIIPDAWKLAVNYYVTKKTEQGYKPRVFSVENIYANYSGTEQREKIFNFIKDAFNVWGISYVLLVGDINFIPSGPPSGDIVEKDNYYVLLDGPSDYYQDVYIGRLPAAYSAEAQYVSTKWANYNTHGWGRTEFCLDGEDLSGTSKNDFADYSWLVKEMDGSDVGTTIQPQDVVNQINYGYGLINWHGHGTPSLWAVRLTEPEFYYWHYEAHNMSNNDRLSFVNAAMSCSTGKFSTYNNIAKEFIKAPQGGAIGYFGANESFIVNFSISDFVFKFINNFKNKYLLTGYVMPGVAFHDAMNGNGQALDVYNLLGDPTAKMDLLPEQVDTTVPQIADIQLSANSIFPGNSSILSASISDNDCVGIVTARITSPNNALLEKEMKLNKTVKRYEATLAFNETVQIGTYQIQVYARDISQNEVVLAGPSLIVLPDAEPPLVTGLTISPQLKYTNVPVTIKVTVTDNAGSWKLDRWAEVTLPDGSTVTITNTSMDLAGNFKQTGQAGKYFVIAYTKDFSGNEAVPYQASFDVIIDNELPVITDYWVSNVMNSPFNIVKISAIDSPGTQIYLYQTVTDNAVQPFENKITAWVEMTKPDLTVKTMNQMLQGGVFLTAYCASTTDTTQPGLYSLRYYARDPTGNLAQSEPLLFQVGSSNQAPILNPIGSKSVNEGSLLQFNISATDANGDSLTYSADNLPAGASFNGSTRTFGWTPNFSQAGIYSVTFNVIDGKGGSDSETIAITVNNVPQVPSAPSGLSAIVISSSQINLSWLDNSNNETGFKIERKTGATGTYSQIASVGSNVSTYSNTSLTAATTYYYRVRAYNFDGDSSYSNEISATTQAAAAIPAAPANLSAQAFSATSVKLTWSDNSTNETGFKIERRLSTQSTYSQIATVGVNTTTYTNTGLSKNKTYYYRIRAYNSNGNSGYSNIASATTPRR